MMEAAVTYFSLLSIFGACCIGVKLKNYLLDRVETMTAMRSHYTHPDIQHKISLGDLI